MIDLFTRADGSPMEFTGSSRGVDNDVIADIRHHGGSFNTTKLAALQDKTTAGNHSIICLANKYALLKIPTNTDVFDQDFVRRSLQAGQILSLADFRVNQRSVYVEAYDPAEILWGRKKWSEGLTVRPESEGEAVSGIDDDDDVAIPSRKVAAANVAMHRMPYSMKEEEKMVQYLIDRRAYNSVKGNKVWKDLEAEGRLGRSWQSMKERYVKHVVPKLHRFKCVDKKHMKRFKDAWNGLEVTVTDSDSDSSDCVAVDKPKTPSQPKDNDKSAQLQSNRKEEVKKPPDSRKMSPSKGTALTNGNEQICNAPEVKKRQTGLFEWIRSKTTKVVKDQERTELEDEQTDAILEVTFEGSNGEETGKNGGKSFKVGEESDKALDEVLGSPAKPDPSKFGKVYSGKKATPSKQSPKSRLRSPHHNVSRETSPVAGPSWRRTPVKSMPEKSSFDLPRNADPVVVIQRLDSLDMDALLGGKNSGKEESDSSYKETQAMDYDRVEEEVVDAAPSPSDPSTSSSSEPEEDNDAGLDETWKEEMELKPSSYTTQEDKDIVLFLIKTRKYSLVKGTDVWESMSRKLKKPRTWQSLKDRFFRNIAPNLQSYNFGPDICTKIQLGLEPKPAKKKKTVADLYAENNLSPLALSDEEEEPESRPVVRGQKRQALTPPTKQTLPSQSPNKTQREGGLMAKGRKLVNPKEMFGDSPISNPTQSKPSQVRAKSQFSSQPNNADKSQEVEVSRSTATIRVKSPRKLKSPQKQKTPQKKSPLKAKSPRKARTPQKSPLKVKSPGKLETTISRGDPFSQDEDLQILQFIATTKRYKDVKGNTLWEHMERKADVCPGRTSQSMKERFRKRIVTRIDSFAELGLTPDQVQRFKDYSGPKKK